MKFHQGQVAFKEQIALLEQIKSKQVRTHAYFLIMSYLNYK